MTPEDLTEIRARLAAATPGVWTAHCNLDAGWVWSIGVAERHQMLFKFPGGTINQAADAAFIANAPADIAALLAEIDRLRELIYAYNRAPACTAQEGDALWAIEAEGLGL